MRLTIVGAAATNDVGAVLKSSGGGGGGGEGEEGSTLQQLRANPAYSSALASSKFSWLGTYTAQNHLFAIKILGFNVSTHMTKEDP